MTARDTIAKLHHDEIRRRVDDVTLPGWDELAEPVRAYYYATADAVIAAIRAMPGCGECDGSGYQSVAHTLEGDADLAEAPPCVACDGLGRA